MAKMKTLDWISFVLTTIGALVWGILAISPSTNLVQILTFNMSWLTRLVYALVGLAGIYSVWTAIKLIKR